MNQTISLKLIGAVFAIGCLVACTTSTTTLVAPSTTLPQISVTSAMATPQTTSTQTPTTTPSASPTLLPSAIPVPTKAILLQFGTTSGDGGYNTDAYFGREAPSLVIYADGQAVIKEGDRHEYHFRETMLSDDVCSILSTIKETGFFDVEGTGSLEENDPIYRANEITNPPGGAPGYFIQVNGEPHKYVLIHSPYVDYLIDEVRATYDLLSTYQALQSTIYRPEIILLWIEKGHGLASDELQTLLWPNELPAPDSLLGRQDKGQVTIVGEMIEPVMTLFNDRLTDRLFEYNSTVYWLIARPLLPHETPDRFSIPVYEASTSDSPIIDCS